MHLELDGARSALARLAWIFPLPMVLLGFAAFAVGYRWFWVMYAAIVITGWIPTAVALMMLGHSESARFLGGFGQFWALPMVILALTLPEPSATVDTPAVLGLLRVVLFGGGLGVVVGAVTARKDSLRVGHSQCRWLLPAALAPAGVSLAPLFAAIFGSIGSR